MNRGVSQRLVLLAVFAASFAMPALRTGSGIDDTFKGYECLEICGRPLIGGKPLGVETVYYGGFWLTNALFVVVLGAGLANRSSVVTLVLAALATAHVVSWPLVSLSDSDLHLQFGYFSWLAAYLALTGFEIQRWRSRSKA